MWLVADQTNVVAMEVLGLKAGSLTLSPRFLLEHLTEAARCSSIDISWYRNGSNPVAVLRFQADNVRPTFLLRRFEIQDGQIVIEGIPPESGTIRRSEPGPTK